MADFSWAQAITQLLGGDHLDEDQAAAAMTDIMDGVATPAQIAGFVIALRAKGETVDELVGLVKTMRSFSEKVQVSGDLLDTCGTGGDRTGTFNVSTAAALVCAGAGVKVAKHGNRAASSRCGSADVLEALGVKIDLPPDEVATCIEEAGIGFCFAPVFHPAMRHTAVPRRELGVATIFNFLGPLTNPAGATRQALGVADPRMVDIMVEALSRLGSERVLAFHGAGGLDELSTAGPSYVVELNHSTITRWTIDPAELDLPPAGIEALAGGTADENAAEIRSVLDGTTGPKRDVVVLNAAAGLVAAGRTDDIAGGLTVAQEAIDSGSATEALDRLIKVSSSA
ncbi:MAG: anthranilate phosphoribosyltransferase [Actinomycetota bacterium]|jgi:anthranilate phosphoribosyltransferase|nr:anthranilate phosphoribosyltransferase [Actinomycetota bacterium]